MYVCQGIPDVPWMSWDVPGVYVCQDIPDVPSMSWDVPGVYVCVRVSLTYHGCHGMYQVCMYVSGYL